MRKYIEHVFPPPLTCTHIYQHTHMQPRLFNLIIAIPLNHTHTHTHTCAYTHTHAHACMRIHTHTGMHAHTHTHTHTHTHNPCTDLPVLSLCVFRPVGRG